jgi:hypothetical protein
MTTAAESLAAYSISEIARKTVSVKAKFAITSREPTSAQIKANAGGILGIIDPVTVNFVNGVSSPEWVTIPLTRQQIASGGINKQDIGWAWQYMLTGGTWTSMGPTNHRIYVVLSTPKTPWTQSFYPNHSQLPWAEVLEFACDWAKGKTNVTDAAAAITEHVNGSIGLTYDSVASITKYTTTLPSGADIFQCTEFLAFLRGGAGLGHTVNCTDCASMVTTFANIVGCELTESTMYSYTGADLLAFKCNEIVAIGAAASGWAYPFSQDNEFAYHEVAWTGATGYNDHIFDACLKVA